MPGGLQVFIGLLVGGAGAAVAYVPQARAYVEPYLTGQTDAAAWGGMIAGGLWIVFGVLTVIFGGLFGGKAPAEAVVDPGEFKRQLNTFHKLLGGAAARMVGADGKITAPELAMVSGILEKHGGVRLTEKEIRELAGDGVANADVFLKQMAEDGAALKADQKEHIVRASLLVAMSDLTTDERELAFLNKVAEALGLSNEELDRVRSDVQNVAARLVGAASAVA